MAVRNGLQNTFAVMFFLCDQVQFISSEARPGSTSHMHACSLFEVTEVLGSASNHYRLRFHQPHYGACAYRHKQRYRNAQETFKLSSSVCYNDVTASLLLL